MPTENPFGVDRLIPLDGRKPFAGKTTRKGRKQPVIVNLAHEQHLGPGTYTLRSPPVCAIPDSKSQCPCPPSEWCACPTRLPSAGSRLPPAPFADGRGHKDHIGKGGLERGIAAGMVVMLRAHHHIFIRQRGQIFISATSFWVAPRLPWPSATSTPALVTTIMSTVVLNLPGSLGRSSS